MFMIAAFVALAGTQDKIDGSTQTEIEYADESTQTGLDEDLIVNDILADVAATADMETLDLMDLLGIEYDNLAFFDYNNLDFVLVGQQEEEEEEDEDVAMPVAVVEEESSSPAVFWLTVSIVVITAVVVGAFLYFFLF